MQLLAVLPAASKELLPQAYRHLMTSANSELIHFYPNDFETDLNGKNQEWEAVVLIPFIDEVRHIFPNNIIIFNLKMVFIIKFNLIHYFMLETTTESHVKL